MNVKKEIEDAAYFISKREIPYDQLCWLLAEMEISSKKSKSQKDVKFIEDSYESALKFFHNWISQCIDIGGQNLPKTISAGLGSKLGKIYKKKGITDITEGLKTSYETLNGTTTVRKIDSNSYEIHNEYSKNFCPIGGKYNPDDCDLIQDSLCIPFTLGFLSELDPRFKFGITMNECILKSNKNACCYRLNLEDKPK